MLVAGGAPEPGAGPGAVAAAQSASNGSVGWCPLAFMRPMQDSAEPSEYALECWPNMPALLGDGAGGGAGAGAAGAAAGLTTVAIFPSHCSGRGKSLVGTGTTVGAAATGTVAGEDEGEVEEAALVAAGEGEGASERGQREVLVQAKGSLLSAAGWQGAVLLEPVHKPFTELKLLLLLLFFDAILSSWNGDNS